MIKIRPLQDGDIMLANESAIECGAKVYNHEKVEGYTVVDGNKILMVGGVIIMWEGVGEAWLIMTKHSLSCVKDSYRYIRDVMNIIIREQKLRRIQARARADFEKGQKMLKHLGFKYEGCAREQAPDRTDMYMYGKLI